VTDAFRPADRVFAAAGDAAAALGRIVDVAGGCHAVGRAYRPVGFGAIGFTVARRAGLLLARERGASSRAPLGMREG